MRLLGASRPMWPIWLVIFVVRRDTCRRTVQTRSREEVTRERAVVLWIIERQHINLAMRVGSVHLTLSSPSSQGLKSSSEPPSSNCSSTSYSSQPYKSSFQPSTTRSPSALKSSLKAPEIVSLCSRSCNQVPIGP